MAEQKPLLKTTGLMIGYQPGKNLEKAIAGPLDLELQQGQLICLLGPNGCGKSTLLRTLSGLQDLLGGEILLADKNLQQLKPAALARLISLVLTDPVRSGNLDVYSLIALGRYPYSGWLGILSQEDRNAIDYAVKVTHTSTFLTRKMDSLSDGERQKVMLARAIAQDTPLIILDEPTAHLDLPSRIQLMRLLHQLAKETKKAILISTHELDLALQVADQIWLMSNGGHLAAGLPEELVLNGSFQQAFDKDGISFDTATGTFPIHTDGRQLISVIGEGAATFWTKKALVRKGYTVIVKAAENINHTDDDTFRTDTPVLNAVTISEMQGQSQWSINLNGVVAVYHSLPEFLQAL